MALYTGRLLMRGGNESDFDPDKMMPREWAVSTDKGIVRICFKPGVCIRMATYEAFEEDMAKIENILKECQSIQEAVVRINAEVSQNADAVAEYTEQAKQYRDEAKQFRDEAFATTPEGYAEVVKNVEKNTVKIDTVIEKAVLNIENTASGENIHLTDSANAKVREFALFGKATQETTTGKNLLPYPYYSNGQTANGVTFTNNNDGSIKIVGKNNSSGIIRYRLADYLGPFTLNVGNYIVSLGGIVKNSIVLMVELYDKGIYKKTYGVVMETEISFSITQDDLNNCEEPVIYVYIDVLANADIDTTVYPMIRLASIADDTYEPYTGGQPSPNPQYPQPIEISGASYNLLENTATSQTINGVEFVVNEDGSIVANGTATGGHGRIFITEKMPIAIGKYRLTGCPKGGSSTTYYLRAYIYKSDGSSVGYYTDVGDGVFFDNTEEASTISVLYNFDNGNTASNHICYPMIRKASVKNDRYMPYGKGSVKVKSVGKNLIPYPYYDIVRNGNSYTDGGVTFTSNSDGTIIVNGKKTTSSTVLFRYAWSTGLPFLGEKFVIKIQEGKQYTIKRFQATSTNNLRYYFIIQDKNGENLSAVGVTTQIVTTKDATFTAPTGAYLFRLVIDVLGGVDTEFNNVIVQPPMVILESIANQEIQLYKETLATIPTENGLAGIKVDNGGNYTDQNGQQWVCDEVVKYADGSGEYVQKVGRVISSNTDGWYKIGGSQNQEDRFGIEIGVKMLPHVGLSNYHYKVDNWGTGDNCIGFGVGESTTIYARFNGIESLETLNEKFNNVPFTAYYGLAEPIRTPLTVEQIAEIEKVCTFYHVTNISNDSECGMKVTYLADSKNYIDNKLALQAKAREEEMMSMFLLLPEETQAAMIENDTNNLLTESEE